MRKGISAIFVLLFCFAAAAQQAMNNDAVVRMVKAGLSDNLIVTTIDASPGTFDVSAEGLISLKKAGVSDEVVAAIVKKANAPPQPVGEPNPPTASGDVPENANAIVHFYRYKQYEGSALKPSVYCDGTELGRIENGRYLDVKIPVGPHTFYAEDKQSGSILTLEPGKEYFFRTDLQVGFWKGHFRLTEILPEQGKFDVAKLKPLDSKTAVHDLNQAPVSH